MFLVKILRTAVVYIRSLFNRKSKESSTGSSASEEHVASPYSEEKIARYCPGGYHPVKIGDTFNKGRYKIASKLGYGEYSTVWLAFDHKLERHVALKILTADTYGSGYDTFEHDILDYMKSHDSSVPGKEQVTQLLDKFEHQGPNGNHVCLAFEAAGPSISEYRKEFPKSQIPLPIMKVISRQLVLALSYLHDLCGVVHSDIKPSNILLDTKDIQNMFQYAPSEVFLPIDTPTDTEHDFYISSTPMPPGMINLTHPTDLSVKLADLGTASWFDKHLTEWIQPNMLRAPEVILGAEWNYKVDIWNLGLIIWELAQGSLVFDGQWTARGEYDDSAHLAQLKAVLGDMPKTLLDRSKDRDHFYDEDGNLLDPSTFPPRTLKQISRIDAEDSELKLFLDFVESMVKLDPEERCDSKTLLESHWLLDNEAELPVGEGSI